MDRSTQSDAHQEAGIRDALRELFARYAWCFDTGDVDGYVGTFASDGVLDLPDGQFAGHAQIRAYATDVVADPSFVGRQHFVGQSLYDPAPRRWTVRSYAMITQAVSGASPTIVSAGYYADECVETKDGWRFARRTYRRWGGDVLRRFPTA